MRRDVYTHQKSQKPRILLIEGQKELETFLSLMFQAHNFVLEIININRDHFILEIPSTIDIILLNNLGSYIEATCELLQKNPKTHKIPLVIAVTEEERKRIQDQYRNYTYVIKPFNLERPEPITTLRQLLPPAKWWPEYNLLNDRTIPFDICIEDNLKDN
jgi:CheY-like chemotaxis protein